MWQPSACQLKGRKSNAQLLMLYGFSMERNTQDTHVFVTQRVCCCQNALQLFLKDFVTISAGQLMETSPFADANVLAELSSYLPDSVLKQS